MIKTGHSPNRPKALVTTFSGDPKTERAFTWYTSPGAKAAVVEYAPEGEGWLQAAGTTEVFDTKCSAGTDFGVRHVHKVRLQSLKPGTLYRYRAGDGERWSETGQFETEHEHAAPFTFLNITDPQGSVFDHYEIYGKVLNEGLRRFPESRFIVMGGDAVEEGNREDWWDYYFDCARPHIGSLPLMSVVGNHETRGGGVKNFNHHFTYPANGYGLHAGLRGTENNPEHILETDNTVYSFDYGCAHFSCLNTGSSRDGKVNPEGFLEVQREWLRQDIGRTDKTWKIVVLHRAPYGSNEDNTDVRDVFAALFEELGVGLVLQGHDHVYLRTVPMLDGKRGPVYLMAGASGRKLYPYEQRPWACAGGAIEEQIYAGIHVAEDEINGKVYSLSGKLVDQFTLKPDINRPK
jgi:hypothetical protein